MAPILGVLTPREWTFGWSPYNVLVVVGASKPSPPGVQIFDGFCTKDRKEPCANPNLDAVTKAVVGAGMNALPVLPAKAGRKELQIFFKKGFEAAAQTVMSQLPWDRPIDHPAEWTWGGDFDLAVVVPGPE